MGNVFLFTYLASRGVFILLMEGGMQISVEQIYINLPCVYQKFSTLKKRQTSVPQHVLCQEDMQ